LKQKIIHLETPKVLSTLQVMLLPSIEIEPRVPTKPPMAAAGKNLGDNLTDKLFFEFGTQVSQAGSPTDSRPSVSQEEEEVKEEFSVHIIEKSVVD